MSEQVQAEPADGSPFARILGVVTSPGLTFQQEAKSPGWLLPFITYLIVVAVGFGAFSMRADWEAIVSDQLESNPFIQFAPEEQREEIVRAATESIRKLAPWQITVSGFVQNVLPGTIFFGHFMAVLYTTLFAMMGSLPELKLGGVWRNFLLCLLFGIAFLVVAMIGNIVFRSSPESALILGIPSALGFVGGWVWLLNRFTKRDEAFHKMLSVCTHSGIILALGAVVLLAVSLATPAPIQVPPDQLVNTNLSVLIPSDVAVVKSFLKSMDAFMIWTLIVLTIGFRTIAKTSTGISASLTFLPWAGVVMVKMAWSAAFG